MNERLRAAETAATEAVKDAESARMGSVADRCAKSDAEEAAALHTARLEASERRASMMEAARDDAMTQRDAATERIEIEAEESRKELDAARAAAATAHRDAQKLTVALDESRRAAADALTRVESLTERLETAEADYAYAERLTEEAVKELETERARFELEGEKRARREKEFMREAEQAASQRWEAQTQDEVEDLRAQVTSLRAEKERAECLVAAAAAESAARVAAAEERRDSAELVATVVTAATATACPRWRRGCAAAGCKTIRRPRKATPPLGRLSHRSGSPGDATPAAPRPATAHAKDSNPNRRAARAGAVPRRKRRAHAGRLVRRSRASNRGNEELRAKLDAEKKARNERAEARENARDASAKKHAARLERKLASAEARLVALDERWNTAGKAWNAKIEDEKNGVVRAFEVLECEVDKIAEAATAAVKQAEAATENAGSAADQAERRAAGNAEKAVAAARDEAVAKSPRASTAAAKESAEASIAAAAKAHKEELDAARAAAVKSSGASGRRGGCQDCG